MSEPIRGLWVAVPTPLTQAGDVDQKLLASHCLGLIANGCDGVVPFGTTGEGQSFSAAERLAAVEYLLGAGVAPGQIGLGAAFPAIPETIALTRSVLALGLTHVLLLPPYFYRDVDAAGIEDAFARVIDGVGDQRLRVTLYHIPQVSGVPVPPAAAAALRGRYGAIVAGLKDSSGDFAQFEAFRAAAPDIAVTIGNEADLNRALALGGAGTICGMANIALPLVKAMFGSAEAAGPMKQAISLITGPFIPTLKSVLAAQTGEMAWLRVRPALRAGDLARGRAIAEALGK